MSYVRQFNNPMIKYVAGGKECYYNADDLWRDNFPVAHALDHADLYDVNTGEMLYGDAICYMSEEEAVKVYVYGVEFDWWERKLKIYIDMSVERSEELVNNA